MVAWYPGNAPATVSTDISSDDEGEVMDGRRSCGVGSDARDK